MDVGSAVDGLLLVFETLFFLLTRLLAYVLYLVHSLVSPFLYLGYALLSIALLPLQLLAKFEVRTLNNVYSAHLKNFRSLFEYRPFFIL